jgi:hypothetical protein
MYVSTYSLMMFLSFYLFTSMPKRHADEIIAIFMCDLKKWRRLSFDKWPSTYLNISICEKVWIMSQK